MPPKQTDRKKPKQKPTSKTPKPPRQPSKQPRKPNTSNNGDSEPPIDFKTPIPLQLQQLTLDIFKSALLPSNLAPSASASAPASASTSEETPEERELDTKTLIQTIKSHLYQRDFDSAFTDAGEDLLRAYALRWSAARSLGYAGLFRGVLQWMRKECLIRKKSVYPTRAVCIGGGAGAEIVALAGAWRALEFGLGGVEDGLGQLSLEDERGNENEKENKTETESQIQGRVKSGLSVAAVDIADWSGVVRRLEKTIASDAVPALRSSEYQPPLVPVDGDGNGNGVFSVSFQRADILGMSEDQLKDVFLEGNSSENSLLVTLMFTLNELFSTSMAKTTGFLLRLTEILPSNAVLLVVDSPGSYSTLKMGKDKDGNPVERNYPMKFLLDHTLLSVAEGKWERVYTQDSRWWRRDVERLRYEVGEGAGLEDMRFQLHLYRRL